MHRVFNWDLGIPLNTFVAGDLNKWQKQPYIVLFVDVAVMR